MIRMADLSIEEKNKLIKENPSYGKMVCKCEFVTEGEIIDSIKRPLGATTLDGCKKENSCNDGWMSRNRMYDTYKHDFKQNFKHRYKPS